MGLFSRPGIDLFFPGGLEHESNVGTQLRQSTTETEAQEGEERDFLLGEAVYLVASSPFLASVSNRFPLVLQLISQFFQV